MSDEVETLRDLQRVRLAKYTALRQDIDCDNDDCSICPIRNAIQEGLKHFSKKEISAINEKFGVCPRH